MILQKMRYSLLFFIKSFKSQKIRLSKITAVFILFSVQFASCKENVNSENANPNTQKGIHLNFQDRNISVNEFEALLEQADFRTTTNLDLMGISFGDKALKALSKSPFTDLLQELSAEDLNITDEGLIALSSSKKLKLVRLDLSSNKITIAGLDALLTGPISDNLERLKLRMLPIGDLGAKVIAAHAPLTMKELFLDSSNITDMGFNELITSQRLQALEWLSLGNNEISSDAVRALLNAKLLPKLKVLELSEAANDPVLMKEFGVLRPGVKVYYIKPIR